MDWQTLIAGLETWLWQTPFLDLPNYAWTASGLGLLVLVLYLLMLLAGPREAKEKKPVLAGAKALAALEASHTPTVGEVLAERPAVVAAREEVGARSIKPPASLRQLEPEPPAQPVPRPSADEAVPRPEPVPEPAPVAAREEAPPEEEAIELTPPEGWLSRLKKGLQKTQGKFTRGLDRLFARGQIDDDLMEELEELLITSDLGVHTTMQLLERLRAAVKDENLQGGDQLRDRMKKEIAAILARVESPLVIPPSQQGPYVIMVTGVNGTGKTTTIGKLALRFRQEGKTVLLAAADTFRAAAIQQLEVWAKRANVPLIKLQEGADPSAVAFDAIKAAQARGHQVVIIDTAGRLHTKVNLMEELKKVKRIVAREAPGAPHEVLLVLDATTGQNALQQAKVFNEALGLTGLVLTKLDGTAKGGIIIAISDELKIPIRFIGVGEKIYDLQPFKAAEFTEAIFSG